jgi:uncharacterized membrane protein YbhN (UPF0104 family)
MQNAELFIHLAEIAGVFVGFGALIAVRSGGASGRLEVGYTRGMVAFGVLVIVAGLATVTLSFFELTEHQIWALSSVVVLAGLVVVLSAMGRTPEYRANMAAHIEAIRTPSPSRWIAMVEWAATVVIMLAVLLIPLVILLGVAPDLEAGLYFALVAVLLLNAAWLLLDLVFAQRLPKTE